MPFYQTVMDGYAVPGVCPKGAVPSIHWAGAMRSVGDSAILCRARDLLAAARKQGAPAWWYLFTATPIASVNVPSADLRQIGAFHGAEVPFVFGDVFELSSDGERHLSAAMGCYWTNFATTSNPNVGVGNCTTKLALPEWSVDACVRACVYEYLYVRVCWHAHVRACVRERECVCVRVVRSESFFTRIFYCRAPYSN